MNRVKPYTEDKGLDETDALEDDIKSTRERMDDTIEALSHKMNPNRYIHEAGDWVKDKIDGVDTDVIRDSAVRVGRKTGDIVRDHPVPLALGALALASWFIRKPSRDYDRKVRNSYIPGHPDAEGATGVINPTLDAKVKQLPESSDNAGHDGTNGKFRAVTGAVSNAAHSVGEGFSTATSYSGDQLTRGKEEYPAGMALGAMAVGFLAAFALPRTRAENQMCGESADEFRHSLADQGRKIVADTKANIREKSDELVDEVRHLTEQKIGETQDVIDGKIEETKDVIEKKIVKKAKPKK